MHLRPSILKIFPGGDPPIPPYCGFAPPLLNYLLPLCIAQKIPNTFLPQCITINYTLVCTIANTALHILYKCVREYMVSDCRWLTLYSCADTLGQAYICSRPSISPSLSSRPQSSVSVPIPQLAAVVPFLHFLISYFPFLISSFLVLSPHPARETG